MAFESRESLTLSQTELQFGGSDRSQWPVLQSEQITNTRLPRGNETRETKANVLNEKKRATGGIRKVLIDGERSAWLRTIRDNYSDTDRLDNVQENKILKHYADLGINSFTARAIIYVLNTLNINVILT